MIRLAVNPMLNVLNRQYSNVAPTTKLFIDGQFVESKTTQWVDLHDPATNNLESFQHLKIKIVLIKNPKETLKHYCNPSDPFLKTKSVLNTPNSIHTNCCHDRSRISILRHDANILTRTLYTFICVLLKWLSPFPLCFDLQSVLLMIEILLRFFNTFKSGFHLQQTTMRRDLRRFASTVQSQRPLPLISWRFVAFGGREQHPLAFSFGRVIFRLHLQLCSLPSQEIVWIRLRKVRGHTISDDVVMERVSLMFDWRESLTTYGYGKNRAFQCCCGNLKDNEPPLELCAHKTQLDGVHPDKTSDVQKTRLCLNRNDTNLSLLDLSHKDPGSSTSRESPSSTVASPKLLLSAPELLSPSTARNAKTIKNTTAQFIFLN
ncbi:hypothetical protein HUJ04_010700 [Dendroctonus ponderosae]|nr:hypothetical protein HUJ04_010700 [Dendroctonus ponderosae]